MATAVRGVGAVLQPAQGWAAGQLLAALDRALPGQILAQRVMVVEILVTERDPVDALAQQIDLAVGDHVRSARIGDHRIQRTHQAQPPIGRAQHHHPAIAGDIAAGKTLLDFAAIEAWKMEKFGVTVWH